MTSTTPSTMTTAIVTIARGRREHLALQGRGIASAAALPTSVILVAMDDPDATVAPIAGVASRTIHTALGAAGLPLARARNLGARAAIDDGADLIVFLDVDCVPDPGMLGAYREAAETERWRHSILCGPVAYLPPAPVGGYDLAGLDRLAPPHPARPAPEPGVVEAGTRPELFWSLSFAVTADTWDRLAGFDEAYEGYGAEDTDFAMAARGRGVGIAWVGGARAYHQHHPVSKPPVEHLDDILRNARIYRARWGEWPMTGWLNEFARLGLVRLTADTLELTAAGRALPR